MKILLLSDLYPPYSLGGSERIACQLAEQYARSGHEVIVITTVQQKVYAGEKEKRRGQGV